MRHTDDQALYALEALEATFRRVCPLCKCWLPANLLRHYGEWARDGEATLLLSDIAAASGLDVGEILEGRWPTERQALVRIALEGIAPSKSFARYRAWLEGQPWGPAQ